MRTLLLLVSLYAGVAVATEEPKYTVESTAAIYEIRAYPALLVAETTVTANFDDAGSKAFRILADFIFGNNVAQTKIAMTAPVAQQPTPEKIAMTAPVVQTPGGGGYTVQFTMPAKYTLETIPKPKDERVHLRVVPARRVAVYRYSGGWSEASYRAKLAAFKTALNADHRVPKGEPTFARFNSPFSLPMFRRNEIWIELNDN